MHFSFPLLRRTALVGLAALATAACNRDDDNVTPAEQEAVFSRLLVTDGDGTGIQLVNPAKRTSESFSARYAGSSVYPSASGRFAGLINFTNNFVQFFDSGIEAHDDHAHLVGTPKWAAVTANAPKPTHFYAWGNRMAIFNDGDGSITLINEADMHNTAATPRIIKADVAHHGAVAAFSNNTLAVTEKDGTVSGSLPERVKIISETGTVVHTSKLATKGIHGEAGNGEIVLFGHREGVLVVGKDGSQRSISNPASLGTNWLSTIYHDKGADAFYGYNARAGVYRIDVAQNQIRPVLESDQVALFRVDDEGREVMALLNDGTLRTFDGRTGASIASAKVADAIDPAAKVKPDMAVSKRFVYISQPDKGEIRVVRRSSLTNEPAINVSGKPAKLALIGAQVDGTGTH